MMPDSVIADAASQPEDTLDLSQMLGAPPTPNQAQAAQAKGGAWKQYAPLMALLPIAAAKGGRMGVAALLNGVQQAQQRAQAEQMRAEQMGMQRQQFDATQQYRQETMRAQADQQRQRMAQELLRDLASGLQGAEDEQQAQQFIDAMLPAIQQAGIPMGRIEAMRMQLAAPDRLRAKKAKKALDAVLATTPKENLGDVRVDLDGDGNTLGIDELTAVANQASGVRINRTQRAPEPKAPTPPAVGSFEDFVTRSYGSNPTPSQIRQARKDYMQADDRTPQPASDPLMQVTETDPATGEVVTSIVPRKPGEVSRKPPAEPNQAQYTAAGYAERMEQASASFDTLERSISQMNPLTYAAQEKSPTAYLQSGAMQSFLQASRNFINAVLRRESGAVISPSEFAEARQQYLPQPGDTPETLAQKRINRQTVMANVRRQAGRAYQPTPTLAPPAAQKGPMKVGRFTVEVEP